MDMCSLLICKLIHSLCHRCIFVSIKETKHVIDLLVLCCIQIILPSSSFLVVSNDLMALIDLNETERILFYRGSSIVQNL